MLILIDKIHNLWIDDSFIAMVGEEGLESTFTKTRIAEQITKGRCLDVSFRKGKRSLLVYPSGLSVITAVSAAAILRRVQEQRDIALVHEQKTPTATGRKPAVESQPIPLYETQTTKGLTGET